MFAAVVTGAPPTNLFSFYNTLYRSSGNIQKGITEVGQVRMGTTPFEDFEFYLNQSPIHHTEKITQKAKWMVDGVPFLEKGYANPRRIQEGS